jgi:hypothetical protein
VLQVLWFVSITDREHILWPIVEKELNSFVEDLTGKKATMALPTSQAIAALSEALATELTVLTAELRCSPAP